MGDVSQFKKGDFTIAVFGNLAASYPLTTAPPTERKTDIEIVYIGNVNVGKPPLIFLW